MSLEMSENNQIISISASKIKLAFEDCYGKYYFKYVEKIKTQEVVWPGTLLGEVIHKFIENSIHAIQNKVKLKDFKQDINFEQSFTEKLAEYKKNNKAFKFSRGTSKKDFLLKGQKYSELFVKFIYGFIENQHGVFYPEHRIEFIDSDNNRISGIIDLLIQLDNLFSVIDFKTTGDWNKWFYVDWKNDIQSLMYLYLVYENKKAFIKSYDYLILDHEQRALFFKNYEYLEHELDEKIQYIKRIIAKLVNIHKDPDYKKYKKLFRPEQTKCHFCDFKDKCAFKTI
jgi:hypothetical protein